MARIGTYNLDESIDGSEKLIGSDAAGLTTRNFTIESIAGWLNSNSVIGIAGQSNFLFQHQPNVDGRLNGSISFQSYGGDGTSFSDLTSIKFSGRRQDGSDISPYLVSLVSEVVILFDTENISNFGIYTLTSFEVDQTGIFYDAVLSLEQSNGSLIGGNIYGYAIYPSTAITPILTLDNVTDEGAVTDNSIEVGGLTVTGDIKNYNESSPDIGLKQDNDLRGYGNDYISNKTIAYSRISSAAFDEEGAIRIKDNVFQTYIGGEWQDVPTGFRFRQDSNGNYEFEHKPTGFDLWIEVSSGNSDILGFNGLPLVQQYAVSMGAYPVPLQLDGGTF
jgi:hypothetical protein